MSLLSWESLGISKSELESWLGRGLCACPFQTCPCKPISEKWKIVAGWIFFFHICPFHLLPIYYLLCIFPDNSICCLFLLAINLTAFVLCSRFVPANSLFFLSNLPFQSCLGKYFLRKFPLYSLYFLLSSVLFSFSFDFHPLPFFFHFLLFIP